MYTEPKKEAGMWITRLASDAIKGAIQFSSASRQNVKDWIAANTEAPPADYQHNASLGKHVWRGRNDAK